MKEYASKRALTFTESVIREMTRVCLRHNGVNLAQGFPDFPAPEEIKEAALRAPFERLGCPNGKEKDIPVK